MRIWDALKTTDPRHTKEVGFGRKFTSIDAQWQLQRMTEQFGPVGEGWGYTCVHSIQTMNPQDVHPLVLAVVDVTIWWGTPMVMAEENKPLRIISNNSYGPIRATCELYGPFKEGKMRLDDDAPKKAMTDALTKGLSHLGLSADVFLGMYDDNKYVAKLKAEFSGKAAMNPPPNETPMMPQDEDVSAGARRWVATESGVLATLENAEDVKGWSVRNAKALKKLQSNFEPEYDKIMAVYGTALGRAQARV
jgi:hypothetical protein